MAVLGNIQIAYKDLAWFNTNPTKILKVGQHVYLSDGANEFESAYTIGDGITQLQFLPWKGVEKGIPLSGTATPITGPLEFSQSVTNNIFTDDGTVIGSLTTSGGASIITKNASNANLRGYVNTGESYAEIGARDGGGIISIDTDIVGKRFNVNAVNGLRGTVFTPTTVGDYIQKGFADTTYQPVGSYLSGTVTVNQIAVGGVSGLVGSAALTYNGTNLQYNKMGSAFDSNYLLGDFQYGGAGSYSFLAVQNKITTSSTGFIFGESNTRVALFTRQGTTAAGTFAGTSIAMADTVVFQNGSGYNSQIHLAGSLHTRQAGLTGGNYGDRLDTIGYRIDDIANIHTTNLNRFTVNGKSYLGGNVIATSTLDLASVSNAAQLRIIGNSSVALSSNGEIGYDLTHVYIRIGSTNYQLDQQVTNASVLAAIGYTPYNATNPAGYITSAALAPYELLANKATVFTTLNNTLYPTTLAVSNYIASFGYGTGNALTTNPLSQFAATTSLQLAGVISDETGTGQLVFATSPTLVTPVLGVATANTINKVTITAPTTNATLTLVQGSSLVTSGAFALTLTTTAASTPTFPTGTGTLAYLAGTNTWSGASTFSAALTLSGTGTITVGARNFILDTTTGTQWGTLASQKQGWYGATPVIKQTTAITGATYAAVGGSAVSSIDTFGGYTMGQVVAALKLYGFLT